MESFLVGEAFPIAPITTQTTSLANDRLHFPLHPPAPPLPPVPPSPSARDISSRRKIHAPGHGAPIGNGVAAEHESFPAPTTMTTITITTTTTTTATVIAAVASQCCLQLSRKGSGYGGGIGPTSPYHRTPGYSAITFTTTAAPLAVPTTATDEGGPDDISEDRHQALRVRQLGEGGAIAGNGGR